ncbi:TonB-dependent siderophore receptor [Sinorhizobium americanum]|uniref:Ferrichrome-iron receptor n=1 Tax=Sinorhizobium americanum TaxID=194963 RepID=A0A1L3LXN6_9HYPH|nr:TonB-dependent siderophore receptor [Sinorhizobium americanum]APG94860.1 ferrichrome-iron receptor [Sinorhizobium americanum]OAP37238.1 ligand-gated channel [Sinorhizobium americanum]
MQRGLFNISQEYQSRRIAAGGATALFTIMALTSSVSAQDQGSATALQPLTISGGQGTEEKKDSETVTAKSSAGASKIKTPLIETPRSVSVVTRKELDQRGAQDIIEAVRYSAGVTTGGYGFDPRFDQVYIRGYSATTIGDYKDGLRQPYINYGTFRTEPYTLERVEVIKGPVSVLYGAGSPAGIVNKISKLPTEEPIREVGVLYGTEDRLQGMFDFGGPVSEENDQFSYRLVGLARNGETNFDIGDDRYLIQPGLTWQPNDSTTFTIYGLAQADETDTNVGAVVDPSGKVHDLRASDPDYDYQKVRQQQIGYQFEHEFDGGITFRQNLRYSHLDLRSRYLGIYSWTGTVAHRGASSIRDEMNVFQVDNQLEAKFDTGPAAHTMLFGLDYTNLTSSFGFGMDSVATPAYDFDIANPTYRVSGPTPGYNVSQAEADLRQVGIYALDQVELDRWRFTFGGRQTWVEQDRDTQLVASGTSSSERVNKDAFSMQAGALYLFDNGIAPFASYATSFEPIPNRSTSGAILDPLEGEQFELGVKYQPPGTDVLLSAVAYQIIEKNKPVLVDPTLLTYRSLGEVTSRGLELEARAAVSEQLDLIAAYTYNHAEITGGSDLGNTPAVTPEHVATLWANYTFAEDMAASGLSLGAGVRYLSETYKDTGNATGKNEDAFYLDAAATYDFGAIDKKYEGLTAQVNVRNIGNEKPVVCNEGYCYLSQGRNVTASLKYRW